MLVRAPKDSGLHNHHVLYCFVCSCWWHSCQNGWNIRHGWNNGQVWSGAENGLALHWGHSEEGVCHTFWWAIVYSMLGALAMPGHCMLLNSGKKNRTRAAVALLEKPFARELNHWLPRFIVEAWYEARKLYPPSSLCNLSVALAGLHRYSKGCNHNCPSFM